MLFVTLQYVVVVSSKKVAKSTVVQPGLRSDEAKAYVNASSKNQELDTVYHN